MLISIITPCLNRAEFVAEAVESVLNQDYPNIEHIIMDGGSTDGTLEVLRRYPHLKVVSEPDQGLYDAINKGITLSRGDILGFLNTDDLYAANILGLISGKFQTNPQIEAVVGEASVFMDDPIKGRCFLERSTSIQPGNLLFRATLGESLFNAWFFRRAVFVRIGFMDTQYRVLADRDFLIRCAIQNLLFTNLDLITCFYRQHTESLTFRGYYDMESDIGIEARKITEFYLCQQSVDAQQRKTILAWHNQILVEQTIQAIRRFSTSSAMEYAIHGTRYNPLWFIHLLKRLAILSLRNLDNR